MTLQPDQASISVRLQDFLTFLEDRLRIEGWKSNHPSPVSMSPSQAHTWMCNIALNTTYSGPIYSEERASDYPAFLLIADVCQQKYHADLNPTKFRLIVSTIAKQLNAELSEALAWTVEEFEARYEALRKSDMLAQPITSQESKRESNTTTNLYIGDLSWITLPITSSALSQIASTMATTTTTM